MRSWLVALVLAVACIAVGTFVSSTLPSIVMLAAGVLFAAVGALVPVLNEWRARRPVEAPSLEARPIRRDATAARVARRPEAHGAEE